MTDITKGLQCLRCYSVVFNINDLLKHIINEPSHKYWKYGQSEGGVVFIDLFTKGENRNEFQQ